MKTEELICKLFDENLKEELTIEEENQINSHTEENNIQEMIKLEIMLRSTRKPTNTAQEVIETINKDTANSVIDKINQKEKKRFNLLFKIASCVVIAILLGIIFTNSTQSTQINIISNDTTINASSFKKGDIIKNQNKFNLIYKDNTIIEVGKDSIIKIQGSEKQKQLFLEKGSLYASVTPQNKEKPFIIKTPKISVKVIGTKFALNAEKSSIRVQKGTVQISHKGKRFLMKTGEAFFVNSKNKARLLGKITQEDFETAKQKQKSEIDLSKYKGSIRGKTYKNENQETIFTSKISNRGRFKYDNDKPFFTSKEDSICNITFKTNSLENINIAFINKKSSEQITLQKKISKNNQNKWQTISFQINKNPKKEVDYNSIVFRLFSFKEKKYEDLMIKAIWFTDSAKTE